MTLTGLDFSTPENACISLRVLAEKVRVGDVKCEYVKGDAKAFGLGFAEVKAETRQ